ncbi:hypothetical protein BH23PSE1_BH23PSE1_11740 [soil metagenome]
MAKRTFVGLHIPKCAGTSFLRMALEALPRHEVYQNTSIIMNWRDGQPEFLDIHDHARLRVVWGHSVHEEMLRYLKEPVLFTGLREPVARLVSEARYQIDLRRRQEREPIDLAAWLARQRNPMTWFIINRFPTLAERDNKALTPFEKARTALQSFHHVYFTDTFGPSIAAVFEALGVTPPAEKEANAGVLKDLDIAVDLEPLQYDLQLYAWAKERFGGRALDPAAPMPEPLSAFLARPPRSEALEQFLFRSQAGEYSGWKALDAVIEDRVARATRLLKEAETYRRKRDGQF